MKQKTAKLHDFDELISARTDNSIVKLRLDKVGPFGSKISHLTFSKYQVVLIQEKKVKIYDPQYPETNPLIDTFQKSRISDKSFDALTEQSEDAIIRDYPHKDFHVSNNYYSKRLVTDSSMNETFNSNPKFQPIKVSPDKKSIVERNHQPQESTPPTTKHSVIQRHIQIQPIQNI